MKKYAFETILMVALALNLSGCASMFFPDFREGSDVVVDDGGNIEIRKVENKGVLVSDKDNASYDDEELVETNSGIDNADENIEKSITIEENDDEKVEPAKVVEVKSQILEDIEDVKDEDVINVSQEESDNLSVDENKPSLRYLAAVIYFNNGGAVVDNEGRAKLREIAKIAKKNNAQIEVYGFASSRTRNADPVTHKLINFKVSAERADKVSALLRSMGVNKDNISTMALSDSVPMYKEVMPEGERLNRRAEIYLTY